MSVIFAKTFARLSRQLVYRPTRRLPAVRLYSKDSDSSDEAVGVSIRGSKYKIFRDEEAPIILDVEEEKSIKKINANVEPASVARDFAHFSLKRGESGVFDLEELVEILRRDHAEDIFVAKVPQELHYVDYIIVVSGRSRRHLVGLAEYIRKLYKMKERGPWDVIPRLEGETSSDWIALDLGNIALHVMSRSARERFDLESLWAVGAQYDAELNEGQHELEAILKKHAQALSLDDLQPINS